MAEVKIEYADTPAPGTPVLLVPADADVEDDDELPTSEREPAADTAPDPTPPRSAAEALPPRTRRSAVPAEPDADAPLFSEDWNRAPRTRPTWAPGAPPADPRPPRGRFFIVGAAALLGAAIIVAWLAAYYLS